MRLCNIIAPSAFATVSVATAAFAQQTKVPIRSVSAPTATLAQPLKSVTDVREIAGGKVLINSSSDHALFLFDATLTHATALADTMGGSAAVYPRFGKLIPYRGDTTLMYESDSRSLITIDPTGTLGRVVALPAPQDFNNMTSGGPVGADARGRLVYQGRRPFMMPGRACQIGADSARPNAAALTDSVAILRADFETRTVDTLGRSKIVMAGMGFPSTVTDGNCKIISAKVHVNPSIPSADSWTITSRGAIAVVRGHDYHIDWITDAGMKSTPKMPFDWRRLTDDDKRKRVDSARKVIDSLTAAGGYRLESCNGGRSMGFNVSPPAKDGSDGLRSALNGGGGGGGGGGRGGAVSASASGGDGLPPGGGPSGCQTVTVGADFVPLDSMADYIAPIRENAAMADLDGNVWILPTTSVSANGGLLYDVVNPDGVLVERVQLPGERAIAGFGRGGVLYLSKRVGQSGGVVLERVSIVRSATKSN